VGLYRELVQHHPRTREYRSRMGRTLNNLGLAYFRRGQPTRALESYREAIAIGLALVKAQPGVWLYQESLAAALHNLGRQQQQLGRRREALDSLQEAARLVEELVLEKGKGLRVKPGWEGGLPAVMVDVGALQLELARPREALDSWGRAVR